MSEVSSSNYHPIPAETGSAGVEEHNLTQRQAQRTHSHHVHTYPELPQEWKEGISVENRQNWNDFTEEDRGDAWRVVNEAGKTYSDEMIKRWMEEMDTLLVFAGLFSAVLTAFNVESYMLLSPAAPDPVLAALTQISTQLASFSVHDPFINSTQPAFQSSHVSSNSTSPQHWAIWLNALWFSSLICSLSAASVAITVKQWIHEYNSGLFGTSHHTGLLRQHRYNGLVQWKVAAIIAVLPVLLQVALGLFLAGLLILLWNLNRTVAIVGSTFVGGLLAFTLVTIVLPTFSSNCAYLSPLSISVFRLCRPALELIRTWIYKTARSVFLKARSQTTLERISGWLSRACDGSLPLSVHAMQSTHVTKNRFSLDRDVFFMAFSKTEDISLLSHASTCFSDHPIDDLSKFFTRMQAENGGYGQSEGASLPSTGLIPRDMASDMLLVRAHKAFLTATETSREHISSLRDMIREYLHSSRVVPSGHRSSCMLSNMAAVLYNNGVCHPNKYDTDLIVYVLRDEMYSIKGTNDALTDAARRRVIAAIHIVLRTRHASSMRLSAGMQLHQGGLILDILISCSPPSASRSQPDDIAEEDTRWKPLADVIVMAEDEVIKTLQCPGFRRQSEVTKCANLNYFFTNCQDISLEQLASRVSEKMLRALEGALQDFVDSELDDSQRARKHGWLGWLESLRKERDRQRSMRAPRNDEKADGDKGQDAPEHEHGTGHERAEDEAAANAEDEIHAEDKAEDEVEGVAEDHLGDANV